MLADQARASAATAGFDLSAYGRFVYIHPKNACSYSGLAFIGGAPSEAWINGSFTVSTIGHELGHNFGLFHAHGWVCSDAVLGTDCIRREYGDTLDIMGNRVAYFNAFSKWRLGWLGQATSPDVQIVETDNVYEIAPYEAFADGRPKALKILKETDPATGQRTWYYLEYRQPLGFDSFVADKDNVMNGVVFHLGTDSDGQSSFLLDMTPDSQPRLTGR